jgi:hypothetical protein
MYIDPFLKIKLLKLDLWQSKESLYWTDTNQN